MARHRLRLVGCLVLAILLTANGPAFAAGLAGFLHCPAPSDLSSCPCSQEKDAEGRCPCGCCGGGAEDSEPGPTDEDTPDHQVASASHSDCPCCPADGPCSPLCPRCPGCFWCCGVKAPCCFAASTLLGGTDASSGAIGVVWPSAVPFTHTDDLFRPPRA
jgi:hypothetical protein